MMGSDLELGDSTNPKVESESFHNGSSSDNRADSASVDLTGPSDSSAVVQCVESVVTEGSLDSVSEEGNVSDVNNRRAEDSSKLDVSESHDKDVSSDRKHGSVKRTKNEQKKGQRRKETKSKESAAPAYDSMLSMFDDFAANGSVTTEDGPLTEGSGSPGHGYEVGDMVWGKVKSHPWWPGHVFSEEFATTSVRRSKREGLLLVAFFGDSSYGWFDPSELMPFESNYAEKSRQTTAKAFVKAVEEAMDEVSRRSALGLTCMCRSKQNFRKTDVKGYFAVDVPDFEPGAVYSVDAIKKARDGFQPSSALDFIRQLALEPNSEHASIDLIKKRAVVITYRRAVFEEFDETYAQAFGYQPDRPSPGSVKELPSARKPAKAPLSGRQVFADTSGKGKNPAKTPARPNKSKDNAKKDKYLFKRREEPKEIKPKPPQKEKVKLPSSPQLSHIEDSTTTAASDYVLQKRAPATATPEQDSKPDELPSREDTDTPTLPESGDPNFPATTKVESPVSSSAGETAPASDHRKSTGDDDEKIEDKKVNIPNSVKSENGPKKLKASKRPAGELSTGKPVSPEKKKKRKKDSLASETTQILQKEDHNEVELSLSRVLNDLHTLALDPFPSVNKSWANKARQVFLKFRSAVFQKSLNSSPPADSDVNDTKSPENGVKLPPVKPENMGSSGLSSGRPEDPTKGGRKRGLSDRQEEMSAKKKKKVGDIKNLTKDNKRITKKVDDNPPAREMKRAGPVLGQRAAVPTVLVMKFPMGGNLPSIHELKAKFVRCGPMVKDGTRILWKSYQCRVVFKYKSDAEVAYDLATKSGSLFGNFGVKCYIRAAADFEPPPPAATQLKSCLKKSGEDGGNGAAGKGAARVKFVLDEDESHKNKKNGDGGSGSGSSSFSSNSTMDFNSKNFQKMTSSSSSSPLLPLPISSSGVASSISTVQFSRPPPPPSQLPPLIPLAPPLIPLAPPLRTFNYGGDVALPPPPMVGNYVHNLQRPNISPAVDISQQMLGLLRKCNEVVLNVTNVMGYVPYHPL